MLSPSLSPKTKQKILAAYKQFQTTVKQVTHTHRQNVTDISLKIDQKHIESIKNKIITSS